MKQSSSKPDNALPSIQSTIICDGQWRITSWDKQAEIQFGFSDNEMTGKLFSSLLLTPFSNLEIQPTLSELILASKQLKSNNVKFFGIADHKDLSTFPVEIVATETAVKNSFIVTVFDLTKRKNIEQKSTHLLNKFQITNDILRLSLEPYLLKEELEHILDYLLDLDYLGLTPQASIFLIEQNPNILTLKAQRGFSKDQQKSCSSVHLDDCICGQVAKTGKPKFISKFTKNDLAKHKESSPHGHYVIPLISEKRVVGVMCFHVIEKQKLSSETKEILQSVAEIIAAIIENQKMDLQLISLVNDLRVSIINLREEKKFSESIIQGLNHGLIVADLDGVIQKSNSVAQATFKPLTRSIDGKTLHEILGEEAARNVIQPHSSNTLTPSERELRLTTKTNEQLILNYSTVPREDAKGNIVGLIISITDISEIKFARKEMEKMNRLSTVAEIASAVAHEVRNPLAGIKIMAQSIGEDEAANDEQQECATRITRQVDRLNELLTEFFSYARPVIPKKRITSLIEILSETKPLIHNKLEKNNIRLIEDYSKDLPPIIADPNQVQQVFLNLMLNAIDAIKQHGEVTIKAIELSKAKTAALKKKMPTMLPGSKYVMVTFKDNGSGMDKETTDKVFEPFFTTKTTGSGLGMSIVYRTLRENDAAITVNSKEGSGTTFTIYFVTI